MADQGCTWGMKRSQCRAYASGRMSEESTTESIETNALCGSAPHLIRHGRGLYMNVRDRCRLHPTRGIVVSKGHYSGEWVLDYGGR